MGSLFPADYRKSGSDQGSRLVDSRPYLKESQAVRHAAARGGLLRPDGAVRKTGGVRVSGRAILSGMGGEHQPVESARRARIEETHRCVPGRTALLVVDMQRGFLDPGASLEVPRGGEAIPRLRALIEACRACEVTVVFTQFVYSTAVPCLRGDPFGIEHLPVSP